MDPSRNRLASTTYFNKADFSVLHAWVCIQNEKNKNLSSGAFVTWVFVVWGYCHRGFCRWGFCRPPVKIAVVGVSVCIRLTSKLNSKAVPVLPFLDPSHIFIFHLLPTRWILADFPSIYSLASMPFFILLSSNNSSVINQRAMFWAICNLYWVGKVRELRGSVSVRYMRAGRMVALYS